MWALYYLLVFPLIKRIIEKTKARMFEATKNDQKCLIRGNNVTPKNNFPVAINSKVKM
jgi:hypothetical protein